MYICGSVRWTAVVCARFLQAEVVRDSLQYSPAVCVSLRLSEVACGSKWEYVVVHVM